MLSCSAASRLLMSLQSENARLKQMQCVANVHHSGTQFPATTEKSFLSLPHAPIENQPSQSSHSSLSSHIPEVDYVMGFTDGGQLASTQSGMSY